MVSANISHLITLQIRDSQIMLGLYRLYREMPYRTPRCCSISRQNAVGTTYWGLIIMSNN